VASGLYRARGSFSLSVDRYWGGTVVVSHTPLALIRNSCPAVAMAAASTCSTTGVPRRLPTAVAISMVVDRNFSMVPCSVRRLESWRS